MKKELSICVNVSNRSRGTCSGKVITPFPNCVKSLRDAIIATGLYVELVVCDWGSTDWPLADWIDDAVSVNGRAAFEVKMVTPKAGSTFTRGGGRNQAAEAAESDNLLFLDADMILTSPEPLTEGLGYLRDTMACFPICQQVLQQDGTKTLPMLMGTGNAFVKKAWWKQAGGFPTLGQWGYEDWGFLVAIANIVPVDRPKFPGLVHQWHPDAWRHS